MSEFVGERRYCPFGFKTRGMNTNYAGMDTTKEDASGSYGVMQPKEKRANTSPFVPPVDINDPEAVSAQQEAVVASVGDYGALNTKQKGNYGELRAAIHYRKKGLQRIDGNPVVDLNQPTHQGIDAVYIQQGVSPEYTIVESKFGSSDLNILGDGTKQMSWDWIVPRLEAAVGREEAEKIIEQINIDPANVSRKLYHVDTDGESESEEIPDDW